MARSAIRDYLQNYPFWLFDAVPLGPDGIPVLTPTCGFSQASAPELTLEIEDIREGNSPFRRKIVKSGDVGNVTLSRGVQFFDSDFWRLAKAALEGKPNFTLAQTYRRDFVLVQYFARFPVDMTAISTTFRAQGGFAAGALAALAALTPIAGGSIDTAAVVAAAASTPFVPGNAIRVPARAWVLGGCVPTRYRASGDFDASSSDVSIAELELAVETLNEVSLAG